MGMFNAIFKRHMTHEQKVELIYKRKTYNPELYFPHGVKEISDIMLSLAQILEIDLGSYDYQQYEYILFEYVSVIMRKYVMGESDDDIIISLYTSHNELIKNRKMAMNVFLFSLMHRANNNFSLTNMEDEENFIFCTSVANDEIPLNPDLGMANRHINTQTISDNKFLHQSLYQQGETGYCFEYEEEMVAFNEYHGYSENVGWSSGTAYMDYFQKGYQAFENGDFRRAIDLYSQGTKFNPVAMAAKLEIVSAYQRLQLFKNAIHELNSVYKYLIRNRDIASYYRRYGYIAVDLHQLTLAVACLRYSLNFDEQKRAFDELEYIRKLSHKQEIPEVDIEKELTKHNIPIVTKDDTEERCSG